MSGSENFSGLLKSGQTIILDGGMGALLIGRGFTGPAIYGVNLTDPEILETIHAEYFAAGAQLVCTNTFCIADEHLTALKTDAAALTSAAASAAAAARDAAGPGHYAALDLSPCPSMRPPLGQATDKTVRDYYESRIAAGIDACDCVFFETFPDPEELSLAIHIAKEMTDKPVLASLTFNEHRRTWFGVPIKDAAAKVLEAAPDAIGINCTLTPGAMKDIFCEFAAEVNGQAPLIVEPNRGTPVNGVYEMDAHKFASVTADFAALGARLVGGCCGSDPECISLLASALKKK